MQLEKWARSRLWGSWISCYEVWIRKWRKVIWIGAWYLQWPLGVRLLLTGTVLRVKVHSLTQQTFLKLLQGQSRDLGEFQFTETDRSLICSLSIKNSGLWKQGQLPFCSRTSAIPLRNQAMKSKVTLNMEKRSGDREHSLGECGKTATSFAASLPLTTPSHGEQFVP